MLHFSAIIAILYKIDSRKFVDLFVDENESVNYQSGA